MKKIFLILFLYFIVGCSTSETQISGTGVIKTLDFESINKESNSSPVVPIIEALKFLGDRYEPTLGKLIESEDYIIQEEQISNLNTSYLNEEDIVNNESSNDYLNWFTSYNFDLNEPRYKIKINLKGDHAKIITDEINEYLERSDKHGVVLKSNINNNILSIAVRKYSISHLSIMSVIPYPTFLNIDLDTNLVIDNKGLLSKFGLTYDEAQNNIYQQLASMGIESCDYSEENCYLNQRSINGDSIILSEFSYLFIGDDGKLKLLARIIDPNASSFTQFGGLETSFIILDMNESYTNN